MLQRHFTDSYLQIVFPISSARSGLSKSGSFRVMNRRLCNTLLPIMLRRQLLICLTALAPCSGQALLTGVIKATWAISGMSGYSEVSPKSWTIVLRPHSVAVHFSLSLCDLVLSLKLFHFFFSSISSNLKLSNSFSIVSFLRNRQCSNDQLTH